MKLLRNTLAIIHLLLLTVLALSCSAVYISPTPFWWIQLFGMFFPLLYAANLILIAVWIWRRKKFVFVPVAVALMCYPQAKNTFAFSAASEDLQGIKLLSWNVKNFDLYNWSKNRETRARMLSVIEQERPDIICFQEFYNDNRNFPNLAYFTDTLGYRGYFTVNGELHHLRRKQKVTQQWGTAIFSKFEIADSGKITFANAKSNGCSFVDVMTGGNRLRVYSVHLQSVKLGYDDYDNLEELEHGRKIKWYQLRQLVAKLKRGYLNRESQVTAVTESINRCPYPCIVAGDFNDVPVSYTYRHMAKNMRDAFIEKGFGLGGTMPGKFGLFRIDYVLGGAEIEFTSHHTHRKNLSDHFPQVVRFRIKQP